MFDMGMVYFDLHDPFPKGYLLVWYPTVGLLAHFSFQGEGNLHLCSWQDGFADDEMRALLPLLNSQPQCCPYEHVLAHFYNPHKQITEELIAWTGAWLEEAQGTPAWEQQVKPVRELLSRVLPKLHALGMDISAVKERGYGLLPYTERDEIDDNRVA